METEPINGTTANAGEFIVENILKKNKRNGVTFYYVKWEEYPEEQNTWEPVANLSKCRDLIKKFEAQLKEDNRKASKVVKKRTATTTKTTKYVSTRPSAKIVKSISQNKKKGKGENAKLKPTKDLEAERESSEDSSEEPDSEMLDTFLLSRQFRRRWRKTEIPLCILGSCVHNGCFLHLVRLKPSDPELASALESDPMYGLNEDNSVIVIAEQFRLDFPELVIKYYEKNLILVENAKTVEEKTEVAARTALLHQYTENKLKIDGTPIFNDMMGTPNTGTQRPYFLNSYIRDQIENEEDNDGLDKFGLPETYWSSSESDGNYESSSSDDDDYVPVKIKKLAGTAK